MVSSLTVGPKWILDKHWRSRLAHLFTKIARRKISPEQIKKVVSLPWRNCLSVVAEGMRPRWVGVSAIARLNKKSCPEKELNLAKEWQKEIRDFEEESRVQRYTSEEKEDYFYERKQDFMKKYGIQSESSRVFCV